MAEAHKALSENKGRVSDFQALDKLAERLNDESSNKGKLVDDLLSFLAPITHPERLGKPNSQIEYTENEVRIAQLLISIQPQMATFLTNMILSVMKEMPM